MKEKEKEKKTCCAPCDCQNPVYCNDLCAGHYSRFKKGKPIDSPLRHKKPNSVKKVKEKKTCCAPCDPPCTRDACTKGLCYGHYSRLLRGKAINTPIYTKKEKKKCSIEGCNGLVIAKDRCWKHYQRLRRAAQKSGEAK